MFARQTIQEGEILCIWGGKVIHRIEYDQLSSGLQALCLQIEEEFFLMSIDHAEPVDYFNHSCNPNAGLSGQTVLAALQPIAAGDEVCFDYAMTDGSPYDEFSCSCGASNCRGQVTGNDWQIPSLWKRYEGHFSPYLQKRIDRLRHSQE